MQIRRRVLTSVAGLLSVLLVATGCDFDGAYDLPLPGSPVSEDDSYQVTAVFGDVLNVVPRSPVKVDDVVVGEVTEVDRTGWRALVTMRVRQDVKLPDNANAAIRQVSLLGEKYVALEPPENAEATGQLAEGDKIPFSATGRNPEVEEVLGALSYLLSGGGVAQLDVITREFNKVMEGRESRLNNLLGSLDSVVGTLNEQKGDIITALQSMNRLAKTLNDGKQVIEDTLDVMGPAVSVLSAQHEDLIKMLRSLDRLGVVGKRVLNASKDDLLASLKHLGPILQKLRETGDALPQGLSLLVSFPFPEEAQEIVYGDFANTSIKLDVNLDNLLNSLGVSDLLDPLKPKSSPDNPRQAPQQRSASPKLADTITKCLKSGAIGSESCLPLVSDKAGTSALTQQCAQQTKNAVCKVVLGLGPSSGGTNNQRPERGLLDGLLGGLISYDAPPSTSELMGGVSS